MAQALARKAREWGGLLAAAGGAAAAATPIYDRDWGWHLATYRRMRDELALPTEDLFSYASQGAYEPVHWVFQLVLGGLVDLCGLAGLSVYRLGLSALFAWALYAVLRRAGARAGAALLALSWVLVGAWRRLLVRPHLVSFLGVVLALGILLDWRRRRRGAWRLVPLFLVWANAHPGILFGVLLVLGFAAAETAQAAWRREPLGEHARLWGWVLAACAATGLNPLGFGLFPYLVAHRDMQAAIDVSELRGLFERPERGVVWHLLLTWLYGAGVAVYALRVRGWASWVLLGACAVGVGAALWQVPDAQVALAPLLALLLGALGVSLARGPRGRCDLTLVGAVGAFGILGVVVAREAPLALALLAVLVAPRLPRPRGRALHAAGAAALVAVLALGGRTYDRAWGLGLYPGQYPVDCADWILAERPAGPLYNPNGIGGYLVHRLWPRYRVFTDGRMPMFLEALPLSFAEVEARYAPQILVLDWGLNARVGYAFEGSDAFRARYALVFVGEGGKVYLRRDGPNERLAERFGYRQLGFFHRWHSGLLRWGPQTPAELGVFAREAARARREAPACPYLPPPPE